MIVEAQERPANSDDSLALQPFDPELDRDIFAARLDEVGAAGDGSGQPAQPIDDEIRFAQGRIAQEDAAWFVAVVENTKIGMVFGELEHGEVNVRIWIHPDHRKEGYGTAALRRSRAEMATFFPAVPMVVRAPGTNPAGCVLASDVMDRRSRRRRSSWCRPRQWRSRRL